MGTIGQEEQLLGDRAYAGRTHLLLLSRFDAGFPSAASRVVSVESL